MTSVATFEKILTLRTTEKDLALKDYQQSVDEFEKVATDLYYLLKEREELVDELNQKMTSAIAIDSIQSYQNYISQLENMIQQTEKKVQAARSFMETKHGQLSDTYIEMKKVEMIVDRKRKDFHFKMEKLEAESINEASIQQFLRNRKR